MNSKHGPDTKHPFLLGESSEAVLRAFYRVYNELGYGFLESVYRRAMLVELSSVGRRAREEVPLEVQYRGVVVGSFRIDLLVDDQVVVELKAATKLVPEHDAQALNYLAAIRKPLALILNFGPSPTFRRLAHSNASRRGRGRSA